jgi:DNA-binding HxlR family transcriptional regulator
MGFKASPIHAALLPGTKSSGRADLAGDYSIFCGGGQSPMGKMIGDIALQDVDAKPGEDGKAVAVTCHGTCVLLKTRLSNGDLSAKDKTRPGFYDPDQCLARDVIDGIGDKRTILVLTGLKASTMRFSQIRRQIPDVPQRRPTQTLRKLERGGLITRTVTPGIAPRFGNTLTTWGRSLTDELVPLAKSICRPSPGRGCSMMRCPPPEHLQL